MTDTEGFIIELALHLDFKMTNDDGDEFACTQAQLLEFADRLRKPFLREGDRVRATKHSGKVDTGFVTMVQTNYDRNHEPYTVYSIRFNGAQRLEHHSAEAILEKLT